MTTAIPTRTAAPSLHLDITADICPMTWVKASLALESLKAGDVLRLRLNDGDALRSVPMSAKEDGHRVLTLADNGDTSFTLTIKKDGLRSPFAPKQQDT